MVPGPDCMEDGRMCPNGIHHAAKGCVMNSIFSIDIILPAALYPGVDSASNTNEYHEYFLGVKAAST